MRQFLETIGAHICALPHNKKDENFPLKTGYATTKTPHSIRKIYYTQP